MFYGGSFFLGLVRCGLSFPVSLLSLSIQPCTITVSIPDSQQSVCVCGLSAAEVMSWLPSGEEPRRGIHRTGKRFIFRSYAVITAKPQAHDVASFP